MAVLARGFAGIELRLGWRSGALAVLTGITWATNALGADGLILAGLAGVADLTAYGWHLRTSAAGRLLVLAYFPSAIGLSAVLLAT